MKRSGKCLCGAVSVDAEIIPSLQACHCVTCRTWSGGPFMSVPCTSAEFAGPVRRFSVSDRGERGFCADCGSHLFFFAEKAGIHAVPIGLFDDQSGIPFRAELYVDQKPDYYCFAEETKKLTGAEFRAKFA